MKTVIGLLCLSLSSALSAQEISIARSGGVTWSKRLTWKQVMDSAKASNKYIFMDVYASWCVPCKKLDAEVYSNDSVGRYINAHFIPVKVQMDTAAGDNDEVKSWYRDAAAIGKQYLIKGYPSFLYFSPDGQLVSTEVGFRNAPGFIDLSKKALDPTNLLLRKLLTDYTNGIKEYDKLGDLAVFVKKVVADKELAKEIAKDFKDNYLNQQSRNELLTKSTVDFFQEFNTLIETRDSFFYYCYNYPEELDIFRFKGWAQFQANRAIVNEEIGKKLIADKRPVYANPAWGKIEATIADKYRKVDARLVVMNYKIGYYNFYDKDWEKWARNVSLKAKLYPPKPIGLSVYSELNVDAAWFAFKNTNEKEILKEAVKWIDQAIQIDSNFRAAYLDTKANLLYKLGKVDDAIALQEQALSLDVKNKATKMALDNMKEGLPTYTQEGAIWDNAAINRVKKK